MGQYKRWINEELERKAFEEIIRKTFEHYRDNLMCSQDTIDEIIAEATQRIREQLQGITRDYLKKNE